MGLLDLFKPRKDQLENTTSALEAAKDGTADDGAVNRLVRGLLDIGIDGLGPLEPAATVAQEAAKDAKGDVEEAIDKVVRKHVIGGGVGGLLTGLGGFFTMPLAIPVNVFEFYVQATRMTAAIASLRGYDLAEPHIRTAALLTLVGANSEQVLKDAGIPVAAGGGRLTAMALKQVPPAGTMVINKAIGFRLLRSFGEKLFSRFGRAVPMLGGIFGGGLDGYMMKKIADQARREFPVAAPAAATS